MKKYGEANYDKVMQIAKSAIENRPEDLRKEDLTRTEDWYKEGQCFSSCIGKRRDSGSGNWAGYSWQ